MGQLREGNTNSRVKGKDIGRLGQTMGAGRNGGQERMHRVEKMDTFTTFIDQVH